MLGNVITEATGQAEAYGLMKGDIIFQVGSYTTFHPNNEENDSYFSKAWHSALNEAGVDTHIDILVIPYPHKGRNVDDDTRFKRIIISTLMAHSTGRRRALKSKGIFV